MRKRFKLSLESARVVNNFQNRLSSREWEIIDELIESVMGHGSDNPKGSTGMDRSFLGMKKNEDSSKCRELNWSINWSDPERNVFNIK